MKVLFLLEFPLPVNEPSKNRSLMFDEMCLLKTLSGATEPTELPLLDD